MFDDIFDFLFENMPWIVAVVVIALCVITFVGIRHDNEVAARLMQQCLDDGHKEYECVSMLRSNEAQTTVIPVPIVIGR